jgi:peptide deformylase
MSPWSLKLGDDVLYKIFLNPKINPDSIATFKESCFSLAAFFKIRKFRIRKTAQQQLDGEKCKIPSGHV